jgi:Mn-dependent DtxR family transcriptional regulator
MIVMEKGPADPVVKEKVLAYLETVEKAKSKEIALKIGVPKAAVDLAVKELAFEDKVEYLYITTTFVALKGKVPPPE